MREDKEKGKGVLCLAVGLHYLCFAKIGCGSAKQMKILGLFFCLALALHYLCFAKIGCGSAKQMKILGLFFCLALALHYLCPPKRTNP